MVRQLPVAREVVWSFSPSEGVAQDAREGGTSRTIMQAGNYHARLRTLDRGQASRSTRHPDAQTHNAVWHQGLLAQTPPRSRARGGWRRLDENGDELECEGEGLLLEPRLEQHSQGSPPRAGLGWVWRPASSAPETFHQSDESTVLLSSDRDGPNRDGPRLGPPDMTRSLSRSSSAGAYRFRADREMVGR